MKIRNEDKRAILWITVILFAVNISIYFVRPFVNKPTENDTQKYDAHVGSKQKTDAKLFCFDPNTADSATLVSLGLRSNTARAIVNYRKAGGVFNTPDELSKIYTLSEENFQRLRPYIRIKESHIQTYQTRARDSHYESNTETARRRQSPPKDLSANHVADYPHNYKSYKLKPGEVVDITTADTSQLMKIPGIGTYYANKIIRYRSRMGGFVSVSQLKEIQGLPEDIEKWLTLSRPIINKLQINHLTFGQLLRHPYLEYEQVVAIFNCRKINGAVKSMADLSMSSAFTKSDLERLAPYLDFVE